MKHLPRSYQLAIMSCLVSASPFAWSLTAAQAYALASAAAVNVVPPEPTSAYQPGVPMCNPGGVSGAGGCSSSAPAPAIVSNIMAGVIGTNNNISAYVAPITTSDGSVCETCTGSLAWDSSTGTAVLTISPNTPAILGPDTVLHEDAHYTQHNYDGYLNFNVSGYNSGLAPYNNSFSASEPLAFALENAMLPSAFLYAAQTGSTSDFATLVTAYSSNQGYMSATFNATNQAVNDFSSSLNTSGIVGQLLNDSNGVSAIATLPNGNFLALSSSVADSSSTLSIYNSSGNLVGSLDFERGADMSSAAGRSELVNYILDKLSGATTLLASINPSLAANQAIATQNSQIINLGEQIIANPSRPAPTCDIVCQSQNVHNITQGSNPQVVLNQLAGTATTAVNNATTIVRAPATTGASCSLNGVTVAFGASIRAYTMSTVYRSCGDSCLGNSVLRTCGSGGLSAGPSLTSCTVNTTSRCP